ncbi:uncharacterized protein LOC115761556 [Drosophila novamexicana]|uniref:uncharacterized protein LOC115761556 n=1 Tax=Drosophila novamexicana TaxID=47314 RepID=UPI0011E5C31C|nr:uncharacterized protein LOC115761556 [Drosophila novamexicana]
MPKKVITRRQRKAAEAKRQSEKNARITPEAQNGNGNVVPLPTSTLDIKPSSSGIKPEPKIATKQPSAKPNSLKTTQSQQPATEGAELNPEGKTTVTIIVKDKTTQSDKKVFDLLVDENIQKQVANGAEGAMPLPAAPNEQGSFSKSLTRRAVATFTKIQKLSKVFNKKINYKAPPAKVTEPMNLSSAQLDETVKTALSGAPGSDNKANKTCSCEFCKVVLNQLLAGKKRANEKKVCKNANRRLPLNHLRSLSPGRNNINITSDNNPIGLPVEAKFEDDSKTTQPPSVATRRRIIQMLEKKEKLLEKDVLKKIKQLNKQNSKIKATEQLIKKNEAKQQKSKPSMADKATGQIATPKLAKSAQLDATTKTEQRRDIFAEIQANTGMKVRTNESARISKPASKPKQSAKVADISTAIQQLSVAPVDAYPPKIIGNTGYFILTGNDEQLSSQLNNLAARNVQVQNYLVLEPGVTDKLQQQLEQLEKNHEQLMQRMRAKHNMIATRRQRRSKEPNKYT